MSRLQARSASVFGGELPLDRCDIGCRASCCTTRSVFLVSKFRGEYSCSHAHLICIQTPSGSIKVSKQRMLPALQSCCTVHLMLKRRVNSSLHRLNTSLCTVVGALITVTLLYYFAMERCRGILRWRCKRLESHLGWSVVTSSLIDKSEFGTESRLSCLLLG